MKRQELEIQKKAMVERYYNSGMTVNSWCTENNIKPSSLRYWLTKVNQLDDAGEHAGTDFIEFSPLTHDAVPVAVYVGSFRLELHSGFDAQTFRDAVHILQTL